MPSGRVAALTAGPRLGGCRRQRQLRPWVGPAGPGSGPLGRCCTSLSHGALASPHPGGAPRGGLGCRGHQPGYLYINPWVCYDSRGLCPGRAGADGCGARGGRGRWCQVWELGAAFQLRAGQDEELTPPPNALPCALRRGHARPPLCQPRPPWEVTRAKPRGREELRPGGAPCPLPRGTRGCRAGGAGLGAARPLGAWRSGSPHGRGLAGGAG